MFPFVPILAAIDPGMIVWVAVAIIWFVGWVSRMAARGQAEQPGPGAGPRRRPQNKKLRDEIEAFLEEATGQRRAPRNRDEQEIELLSADDVEVVEPRRRQRPKPARPKPQRQTPKPSAPSQPAGRPAPGASLSNRHVETHATGESLQKYVQTHMAERVAEQSARDVGPRVDNSVAERFGTAGGEASGDQIMGNRPAPRLPPAASQLLKLMRNPDGVRQAFILSEVIKPPLSRRRLRAKQD